MSNSFHCGPCSVCPNKDLDRHKWIVPGYGNRMAATAFIGERPGIEEHFGHLPFIGKTGQELDGHYFMLAGVNRHDVWMTNANKCFRDGDNPQDWEVDACLAHHMELELAHLPNLKTVVLLGAKACRLAPELRVDLDHGYKMDAEIHGRKFTVFPSYHPAAGMHMPRVMKDLREDFMELREVLAGRGKTKPKDQYPNTDYRLWSVGKTTMGGNGKIAVDTETDRGRCFAITVSDKPGSGRLLYANDRRAIDDFQQMLAVHLSSSWNEGANQVILHNANFDLRILRQVGITIPDERVVDTMVKACSVRIPQALKTLGYRLCGKRMKDYSDVVRPYVEALTLEWLENVTPRLEALGRWRAAMTLEMLTYEAPFVKKDGMPGALQLYGVDGVGESELRLLHAIGSPLPWLRVTDKSKTHRDPAHWKKVGGILKQYLEEKHKIDIIKRVKELPVGILRECEWLGLEPPTDSITQVPEDELIQYACADSDVTLRVDVVLDEMMRGKSNE